MGDYEQSQKESSIVWAIQCLQNKRDLPYARLDDMKIEAKRKEFKETHTEAERKIYLKIRTTLRQQIRFYDCLIELKTDELVSCQKGRK